VGRAHDLRFLLDTHALLWADADDPRLSARARRLLEDSGNDPVLSVIAALEIVIKASAGRLNLGEPPGSFVSSRIAASRLTPLAVELEHALRVGVLPRHHNDPFDRLLIAQAQAERLPVLTSDPRFSRYDVEVIW
jgi:PIN domain nuclease of toxin-antitoxin system